MGLNFSCIQLRRRGGSPSQNHRPPARVIAADGSLKELPASPVAVAVADVLAAGDGFFVCSSDALYFNEQPPAMLPGEILRPGQIYFVLPAAMRAQPLSTADMAALAVRATAALAAAGNKAPRRGGRRKKKTVRVMPLREEEGGGDVLLLHEKLNERTLGEFPASWSSPEREEKIAAAAAAAAARSRMKRALSIIQEDAE
uniref:Uncharacterized protein n=1 Tax=Leersia perrieri TaxID=77586 RepID=A0A0D9VD89_9ORYZ